MSPCHAGSVQQLRCLEDHQNSTDPGTERIKIVGMKVGGPEEDSFLNSILSSLISIHSLALLPFI